MDRQPKCNGCRKIEYLVKYCKQHPPLEGRSKPVCFHNSYRELDFCAERCITCRVIRRGFLLNQATFEQVEELEALAEQIPIWVTIENGSVRVSLQENAETLCFRNKQVDLCMSTSESSESSQGRSLPIIALSERVCAGISDWARDCCQSHPECGNFNWSRKNPTRLIHILSDSSIQVVDARYIDFVQYIALSYCWGAESQGAMKRGVDGERRTVKANIGRRQQPFPTTDLRKTIQDVVILAKGIGVQYIWVDSVCIIQDSDVDWATEASLMARVYSNSYFTLCSLAASHADAALIRPRDAWKYPTVSCQLASQHLTVVGLPLDDLKQRAPYSSRAWILQEEKLSPRILYWTPQRMYWSCMTRVISEHIWNQNQRQLLHAVDEPSLTQSFLRASRDGKDLYWHWKDMIEDYTRRTLTHSKDRFPALSGLAARYQLAQDDDAYLAGLWRNTIAEDLAWRVEFPVPHHRLGGRIEDTPSWSWASLPVGISAQMSRNWEGCDDFRFIGYQPQTPYPDASQTTDGGVTTDICIEKVRKGAQITTITVQGRMRPLLRATSEECSWSDVSSRVGETPETFSFARFVDRNIHCIEPRKGQLLVYEPQRRETVYQLDYLTDTDKLLRGMNQIRCLELGEHTALLVEECEAVGNDATKSYRRLGLSLGSIRWGFFGGARLETCHLV